jgi:multicomponent Na+:H+ antiporter subunit D
MAAGIVLLRCGDVDELRVRGDGRELRAAALAWFVAAVALAGPPFAGAYLGHALIEDGATLVGAGWVPWVLAFSTILTTAAVLRAGARVFLGWGPARDPLLSREPPEAQVGAGRQSFPVMAPLTVALAVLGLAVGVWPGLAERAAGAAARFQDRTEYAEQVLHDVEPRPLPLPRFEATTASIGWAIVTNAGSVLLALGLLYRRRLPEALRAGAARVLVPPLDGLRALHSGHVGDYVAWLTLGTGTVGILWALTLT